MNPIDLYVAERSCRRFRRALTPAEQHTADWLAHRAGGTSARDPRSSTPDRAARTMLRWLGGRLVHLGERLQSWSAAGRQEPLAR